MAYEKKTTPSEMAVLLLFVIPMMVIFLFLIGILAGIVVRGLFGVG